jgi:hypothetical protein
MAKLKKRNGKDTTPLPKKTAKQGKCESSTNKQSPVTRATAARNQQGESGSSTNKPSPSDGTPPKLGKRASRSQSKAFEDFVEAARELDSNFKVTLDDYKCGREFVAVSTNGVNSLMVHYVYFLLYSIYHNIIYSAVFNRTQSYLNYILFTYLKKQDKKSSFGAMTTAQKMTAIKEATKEKGQDNNPISKELFPSGDDNNEPKVPSKSPATAATPVAKDKVLKSSHKQPSPKNKDNLKECKEVKLVVNNTMLPFLYPLFLEKEKIGDVEKKNIVCSITNTNHNQWNKETQRQIMFTFLGNPYDRVTREESLGGNDTPGEDMEVLLVVAGKQGTVKHGEDITVSEE